MPINRVPEFDDRPRAFAVDQFGHQLRVFQRRQRATCWTFLAVHSCDHDLAHDGGRRSHLRVDAAWQDSIERRESFLHRLAGLTDFRIPAEFDVDYVQTGGTLAANCFHTVGSQQGSLDRMRD